MKGKCVRKTKEVSVEVEVNIGERKIEIDTGIGFLDHMLETFAIHSGIGLKIKAKGDLNVDEHHTIEDVAIALGRAFNEAIEKRGINRFGDAIIPMDESVAICGVDLSGRGVFTFEGEFGDTTVKGENIIHFFDSFCRNSGVNVYLNVKGYNSHHKIEASFKALAKALREALQKTGDDVRSAKGLLE